MSLTADTLEQRNNGVRADIGPYKPQQKNIKTPNTIQAIAKNRTEEEGIQEG